MIYDILGLLHQRLSQNMLCCFWRPEDNSKNRYTPCARSTALYFCTISAHQKKFDVKILFFAATTAKCATPLPLPQFYHCKKVAFVIHKRKEKRREDEL
jgi:hypothetical protein